MADCPLVTGVHWNGIFFSSKETEITTDRTPGTKPVGECLLWDSLISKFLFPIKSFIICCSMCGQRFEDFFQGACYRGSVWMQHRPSLHWALAETQAFKFPGTALSRCRRLSSESKVNSPQIETVQLQSSCHILTHTPRSQVLQIWSPRRGDWKTSAPASAKHCSETLSSLDPGRLVFCHRISSFEFQMFVSLFSAEKSIFSPQS